MTKEQISELVEAKIIKLATPFELKELAETEEKLPNPSIGGVVEAQLFPVDDNTEQLRAVLNAIQAQVEPIPYSCHMQLSENEYISGNDVFGRESGTYIVARPLVDFCHYRISAECFDVVGGNCKMFANNITNYVKIMKLNGQKKKAHLQQAKIDLYEKLSSDSPHTLTEEISSAGIVAGLNGLISYFAPLILEQILYSNDGLQLPYDPNLSQCNFNRFISDSTIQTLINEETFLRNNQFIDTLLEGLTDDDSIDTTMPEVKTNVDDIEEVLDVPEFNNLPTKYVLLSELGIIDFLYEKFKLTKEDMPIRVALISTILGFDKKQSESVRKWLVDIDKNNPDGNNPFKKKNIIAAKAALVGIGINID